MPRHFLAGALVTFAACAAAGILPAALLAARARSKTGVALAVITGLGVAAILANAAADLWRAAP